MDLWGPRPQPWDWLHICMGGRDISVCCGLKRISSGQQQLSTLSTCQEAKTLLDAAVSPSESSSNTARVCSVQSRPQTWLYVTAAGLPFSLSLKFAWTSKFRHWEWSEEAKAPLGLRFPAQFLAVWQSVAWSLSTSALPCCAQWHTFWHKQPENSNKNHYIVAYV